MDVRRAANELSDQAEKLGLGAEQMIQSCLERKISGVLTCYHATTAEQVAEEGIKPRAKHRAARIWKKVTDYNKPPDKDGQDVKVDVWVSENHVYLFLSSEEAAAYFQNTHLKSHPGVKESAQVYEAEVSLDRLDPDPEMLQFYVTNEGARLPSPGVFGEEMADEDIKLYKETAEIFTQMHEKYKELVKDSDVAEGGYDPRRIQAVWDTYKDLSWAKQRLLVNAIHVFHSPGRSSLALMHRDEIIPERLRQDKFATQFARGEAETGDFKEFVETSLTEQAWETRQYDDFYLSLEDDEEKLAFKECRWIQNRKDLDEEMAYRHDNKLWNQRLREKMRIRREQRKLQEKLAAGEDIVDHAPSPRPELGGR